MKCTNCGASLSDNAKFCPECGTKVVRAVFCAECGTKLEAGAKFCPECGTKVGGAASAQAPAAKEESYPKDNGSSKWLTIEDDVLTECDGEAEGVVIVPEGVTVIEEGTFGGCDDITEIVIPRSVEQINGDAFSCEGLCFIKVASGNMNYKVEDGVLYTKDGKTLCRYPCNKKGDSFIVPDGVIRIENSAFDSCSNLESVTLRNGVTSIGEDAFNYCKALTSIKLPESLETIEESAFYDCEALESVKIPDSVESIGERAFSGCTSLSEIELPDSVESIGKRAFSGCTALSEIELPSDIKEISNSLFYGCESLESVKIPSGVTRIGTYAFSDCKSLESVKLPSSLTEIGERAFKAATKLSKIRFMGTTDKWNAVEQGIDCLLFTDLDEVSCSDGSGDISKKAYKNEDEEIDPRRADEDCISREEEEEYERRAATKD